MTLEKAPSSFRLRFAAPPPPLAGPCLSLPAPLLSGQFGQCLGSPETQLFSGTSPALPGLEALRTAQCQPCSSAAPLLFSPFSSSFQEKPSDLSSPQPASSPKAPRLYFLLLLNLSQTCLIQFILNSPNQGWIPSSLLRCPAVLQALPHPWAKEGVGTTKRGPNSARRA